MLAKRAEFLKQLGTGRRLHVSPQPGKRCEKTDAGEGRGAAGEGLAPFVPVVGAPGKEGGGARHPGGLVRVQDFAFQSVGKEETGKGLWQSQALEVRWFTNHLSPTRRRVESVLRVGSRVAREAE